MESPSVDHLKLRFHFQSTCRQFHYRVFIGKLIRFKFGIHEFAVEGDLETASTIRDQCHRLDLLLELRHQFARQTEGLWLVTSRRAVFQRDFHDISPFNCNVLIGIGLQFETILGIQTIKATCRASFTKLGRSGIGDWQRLRCCFGLTFFTDWPSKYGHGRRANLPRISLRAGYTAHPTLPCSTLISTSPSRSHWTRRPFPLRHP